MMADKPLSGNLDDFLAMAAQQEQAQPDRNSAARDVLAALLARMQPQQDLRVAGPAYAVGIRG